MAKRGEDVARIISSACLPLLKPRERLPFTAPEMSFTGDILTTTTPARLLCLRGTWVLELVRFVPVDRNVFQPRTQRLEGTDAILQHLKRGDHATLVAATHQLMRGARADEELAFEVQDGDWVPRGLEERAGSSISAPGDHGASNELAELRAELLVLRVSHERLRERVLRLEAQPQLTGESIKSARDAAALESLAMLTRAESARTSDPQPLAGVHCADGEGAPSLAPPVSARAEARLEFPPVSAINICLRALIGDKVTVKERKLPSFVARADERYWVSRLIDDDGLEAGMIVADATATASLGGMLMMLPEQEVNSQRETRNPSEDAVEAMSEVSNNLSGAFNQIPDAIRIRVKPIEPMSDDILGWVTTAAHKTQLEVLGGLGNLFLFSR